MFDSKERKYERLNSGLPDNVSASTYNLIIGALIFYGFLINAITIAVLDYTLIVENYAAVLVGYFASCLIGVLMSKSNNPIMSFIGYNLVVLPIGILLTVIVPSYMASSVLSAIIVTGIVVVIMTMLSSLMPTFFERMGITLFISFLIAFIAEIIAIVFGYGGGIFDWFFVLLFSMYIGYDWHKAQLYPKTLDNAIDSTLDLYLDIINLFVRLLKIFGKRRR